jgi:hypothetical protein
LIVINFLNDPTGNPEGEASFEPFMMPVVSKKVSRVDAAFQLNGRLTSAEGEFVSNPGMAITDKDKLHDRRDNILLIEGSIGIQDDLASLDVALADWGSRDWASAFFYLGDVIDDEDEDDPWGEEGLEVLFEGVSDNQEKSITPHRVSSE